MERKPRVRKEERSVSELSFRFVIIVFLKFLRNEVFINYPINTPYFSFRFFFGFLEPFPIERTGERNSASSYKW